MLLESTHTPLGTACPEFSLPGVDGRLWTLKDFAEPALLLVVMCNHCPYVQAVEDRINQIAKDFKGACSVVGINPNDALAYPEDSYESMKTRAALKGFVFPYLRDESQEVARSLGAVCTPDFFLYDQPRRLVYRGRLDDNWKEPSQITRQDLRLAIEAVLMAQPVEEPQKPSMGCSIKWKTF